MRGDRPARTASSTASKRLPACGDRPKAFPSLIVNSVYPACGGSTCRLPEHTCRAAVYPACGSTGLLLRPSFSLKCLPMTRIDRRWLGVLSATYVLPRMRDRPTPSRRDLNGRFTRMRGSTALRCTRRWYVVYPHARIDPSAPLRER